MVKKNAVLLLLFVLLCGIIISNLAVAEETVVKEFDDAGNCILQLYFDENNQSCLHNHSYYGLSREYGEYGCVSITYLDAEQMPMVNKAGYARVERELDEDGKVIREMYYGVNGEPAEIRHGQYGTQKVYENVKVKQNLPLGKDGKPVFLLYWTLYRNQWLVILGAVFVIVMCVALPRRWKIGLLILYVLFILYMTLYVREPKEDPKYSFDLLWSFRKAVKSTKGFTAWKQIVNNVLLFVPLGFILRMVQKESKVLVAIFECIVFSAAIEAIQYFTGLGFMELDDVVWNGLGAVIGTVIGTVAAALGCSRGMSNKG